MGIAGTGELREGDESAHIAPETRPPTLAQRKTSRILWIDDCDDAVIHTPRDLEPLVAYPRWTSRSAWPNSSPLGGRLFSCGDGAYLMVNPNFGDDAVRGVGWAQSDYWARRVWHSPPFSGDLEVADDPSFEQPSLRWLGRPEPLGFAAVRAFETAQPTARKATLVSGRYRVSDGAFLFMELSGSNGLTYAYASRDPGPNDLPVAVEIRLQER